MAKTTTATDEQIRRAAELLRHGGLVAFPTETVYGLGANALDPAAVARIYAAKGRPSTSPLIVHVDSIAMAQTVAATWPDNAQQLAKQFWPGALTLVLPKRSEVPDFVTAGLDTVGVRIPDHPVALRLIREAAVPLAAPSANKFTHLSPTTAAHVEESLGSAVDLILDGGPTQVGIESTVISLAGPAPVLLRPGMITREAIESVIGPVASQVTAEGAHPAPGMHRKHYSPRTPLILGDPAGRCAYVWWSAPKPAARAQQMPADPARYATALYTVLHQLDSEGYDLIVVEPPPATPEWAGIRDRLERAAAK